MSRNAKGQFEKGCSGNPSGRPKRSEIEAEMIEQICSLAPQAFSAIKTLIESDETPANIRFRCCEFVVERICGRTMSASELMQYEAPPPEKTEQEKLWDEIEINLLKSSIPC